jgi:hypothetical protein
MTTCSICLDPFININKCKTINCSTSICDICLDKLDLKLNINNNAIINVQCPFCRLNFYTDEHLLTSDFLKNKISTVLKKYNDLEYQYGKLKDIYNDQNQAIEQYYHNHIEVNS